MLSTLYLDYVVIWIWAYSSSISRLKKIKENTITASNYHDIHTRDKSLRPYSSKSSKYGWINSTVFTVNEIEVLQLLDNCYISSDILGVQKNTKYS